MWLGRTSGAGAEIDNSSTGHSACSQPCPLSGAWPSQNLSVAPAKAHIDQGGGIQDCTEPSSHRSSYHSPSGNVHLGAPQAGRTEAQHHLETGEVTRQQSSGQTELERQQRLAGDGLEVSRHQWTPGVADPAQSVRGALGRNEKLLSKLRRKLSGDELVLDLLRETGSRLKATWELTREANQSINRREVLVLNLWPTPKNRER